MTLALTKFTNKKAEALPSSLPASVMNFQQKLKSIT